jgi:hypothetical protein
VRERIHMETAKRTVGARIAVVIFVAVMVHSTLAESRQQQTPDSATATNMTKAEGSSGSSRREFYSLEVDGSTQWRDTGVDLRGGAKVQITAEGTITYAKGNQFGPAGIPRSIKDVIHQYVVPNGAHGELIGRLGSGVGAEAFEVGVDATYTAPVAGRLFLGINQSMRDAEGASGSFQVKIEVLSAGLSTADVAGGPAETAMPAITPKLLDSIPRRVADQNHSPGDMVNILIVGTEEELVKAFTTAQWVKVDKSVESTVLSGLMATLENKDYLTMPMSTLYLFDRPQDYGFAHAEPVRVVMSRNHLRVWKSPYQVDGRPLWCVAATHDIRFERDQRNNGVTHKIDPAIDGEREFVNQTLSGTGLVSARGHVVPTHPLTEARTATGGEFHSDGRILVLVLGKS